MRIKITSIVLACCFCVMLLSACEKKVEVDKLTETQIKALTLKQLKSISSENFEKLTPAQANSLTKEQMKSLSPEDRARIQQKAAFYVDPKRDFSDSEKPLPR